MATEPAAYLPTIWMDDSQMTGLLSMIKARSVNPVEYDRKVRFWSDLIGKSCIGEKNALFTHELLRRRFRRGDTLPACLQTVLDHMVSRGELITVTDWKEKHSDWMGWGVSRLTKTTGWLLGVGNKREIERYIHLPTVTKQAEELLTLYDNEFKDEVDCTGEVVAYDEFYDKAINVVHTQENFDIIMDHLTEQGDVTVGVARNGEKILKFRDRSHSSRGPVQFTDADASVHDIRKAMGRLDKEIRGLEVKIQKLDADTRSALRAGEKTRGANFLRQKKRAEKDMTDKDGQYQKLLSMLHQLGSTKHNREVLDAYKMGTQAFKANLQRHGLTPDKIDATMDEVHNAVDDYREIEEAMGQGVGLRDTSQDADLERELEELMGGQKKEEEKKRELPPTPEMNLPEIPSGNVGSPLKKPNRLGFTADHMSLEERLNRLRAEAD